MSFHLNVLQMLCQTLLIILYEVLGDSESVVIGCSVQQIISFFVIEIRYVERVQQLDSL